MDQQRTFEITAPNGKVLEITGDRLPTETELRQMFTTLGVDKGTQPRAVKSATRRFVEGGIETANPIAIVKGVYQMARHPLDTYESMVQQSADQFGKAKEAYDRGGLSEAFGHAAAGVLPAIGPLSADIGEQAGAGDLAGAAGRLTGVLAGPAALKGAGKAIARVVPSAATLEGMAARRVADVMSPKASNQVTRRMGAKATAIAPQILKENRGGWSRAALQEQVMGKLQAAEEGLDAAADARNAGAPIQTKAALDAIAESRRRLTAQPFEAEHVTPEYRGRGARTAYPETEVRAGDAITAEEMTPHQRGYRTIEDDGNVGRLTKEPARVGVPLGKDVVPAPNRPRVAQLDQASKEIQSLGEIAPYESLRTIRQAYDAPARAVYNPSLVDDFLKKTGEAKGAADVTAALRKTLAEADPATAEANAQYALYKSASDILEAAEQLEKARPKVGRQIMARLTAMIFGLQTAGAGGAAAGYVLAPSLDALMNSGFTTKLKTAQALQGIAEATRRADIGGVFSRTHALRQKAAKLRVTAPATEIAREKELAGQR